MNFWEKGEQGSNGNNPTGETVEAQLSKFRGMSEQQLIGELLRSAGGMKAEGKLSAEELESFYQKAAMFLSVEQLSKLRTLINMLK